MIANINFHPNSNMQIKTTKYIGYEQRLTVDSDLISNKGNKHLLWQTGQIFKCRLKMYFDGVIRHATTQTVVLNRNTDQTITFNDRELNANSSKQLRKTKSCSIWKISNLCLREFIFIRL